MDNFGHILWNMLGLWMFGAEIERLWGTNQVSPFLFHLRNQRRRLIVIIAAYLFGFQDVATIGSSGAVYGVLVAYGILFPDRTVLFGFSIPIKSKYFVMIIGGIVLLQSYTATVHGTGRPQGPGQGVGAPSGSTPDPRVTRVRRADPGQQPAAAYAGQHRAGRGACCRSSAPSEPASRIVSTWSNAVTGRAPEAATHSSLAASASA